MAESPVTKTDLTAAKTALYNLTLAEADIERMKSCGLECDEQEARCLHLRNFLKAFLETYGPTLDRRA